MTVYKASTHYVVAVRRQTIALSPSPSRGRALAGCANFNDSILTLYADVCQAIALTAQPSAKIPLHLYAISSRNNSIDGGFLYIVYCALLYK